jgi:hypothetical protein
VWNGAYTNAYYTLEDGASRYGTYGTGTRLYRQRGCSAAEERAAMVHLGWLETRGGNRWHATELGLALLRYARDDLTAAERELYDAWLAEFGKTATAEEWGVALSMWAGNPDMPLAWVVAAAKASCAA